MKCCICTHEIEKCPTSGWDRGHNAQPVKAGRCCDECNSRVVLEKRLENVWAGKDRYGGKRDRATGYMSISEEEVDERERGDCPMCGDAPGSYAWCLEHGELG